MARHSAGGKNINIGVFALELVGSLFFLFLVYLMAFRSMPIGPVFAGTGTFWLPIFAGVSVLVAVAMFFFSLTYLSELKLIAGEYTKNMGLKLAAVAGLTFFAITIGTQYFVVALAGFILSLIGGMVGYRV